MVLSDCSSYILCPKRPQSEGKEGELGGDVLFDAPPPLQVQEMVHGVTTEECQAALQNHGWSVQKAIQYLKVKALSFSLSISPRKEPQECPTPLGACGRP